MPTYDYMCLDCCYKFEAFQKITDSPLKVCSKCNGRVKRLISGGAGLLFRGKDFYITENRSEEYKRRKREDGNS